MNSVGIEPLLKATQAAPKAKPAAPSEGAGEFNDYLQHAERVQKQPAREKPLAAPEPAEAPTLATGQERGSAESPDEQVKPTAETSDGIDEVTAEQPAESETDEVLLSVAALAASSTEAVTVVEASDVKLEVAADTTQAEAAEPQPTQDTAAGQDFLPDLEQALAETASVDDEAAVPSETAQSVEATVGDEAVELVKPHGIPETSTPIVAQVAAQQQGEQQAAEANAGIGEQIPVPVETQKPATAPENQSAVEPPVNSKSDSKEGDKTEPKADKTKVVDKQAVGEQLATQVAAAVVESDSTHESKHTATADAVSATPDLQAEPQSQQQSATRDTARTDAQTMQSDGDSRMPTIDRARFVQRVANAFRSAQQNDGQIQMRLSPPELGSLRIEIAVRNGVLTANLETETSDARRVLLDNLPALRQRLAEQDIRIEKFDVDVRREGSQSDGQSGAHERQAQQQSQRAAAQNRIRANTPTEVISTRVPRPMTAGTDSGLDVRI